MVLSHYRTAQGGHPSSATPVFVHQRSHGAPSNRLLCITVQQNRGSGHSYATINPMALERYAVGQTVVVQERWHALLWSAVPHRVVESGPTELISWVPTGAVGTYASNRELPEAARLSRDERKLLALRSRHAQVIESREAPDRLFFHRADRWSRVNLGWDPTNGQFNGWYVNIELPPACTVDGITSKDLILDIWVNPDRTWTWKDREDYHHALDQGILGPAIVDPVSSETQRVIAEIEAGVGPFNDVWRTWSPDQHWSSPELPAEYGWAGDQWDLPPGRRLG